MKRTFLASFAAVLFVSCGGQAPVPSPNAESDPSPSAIDGPVASLAPTPSMSFDGLASPTSIAEPTQTPVPLTPSPAPIRSATAAPENWSVVATGPNVFAHWSPDGGFLVMEIQTANGPGQLILDDATAGQIASFHGFGYPVWLDNGHFLAYRSDAMPDNIDKFYEVPGIRVDAASGVATDLDLPCCAALGNGHGTLALTAAADPASPKYVVWSNGEESTARSGEPVAWSPKGDRVAVRHPSAGSRGSGGWMEILSWPTLAPIFQSDKRRDTGRLTFDPSGNHAAFLSSSDGASDPTTEINVVNLTDQSVALISTTDRATFAWSSAGQLVVCDGATQTTYAADGAIAGVQTECQNSWIEASADGSTLVTYTYDANKLASISYTRNGRVTDLDLPPGQFDRAWIAPDGRAVVAVTFSGPGSEAYLAALE